jgi:hypothetical protein
MRRAMARFLGRDIPAVRVADAGSWRDLQGMPGAYALYGSPGGRLTVDAACPGCGVHVASIPALGTTDAPTTPIVIFSACCSWTGRLHRGSWHGL